HTDGEKGLAGACRSDAKSQIIFLHAAHVASLAIGAGSDEPPSLQRRQRLRPFSIAAPLHQLDHGLHVLEAELPLMPDHLPELLKDPLDALDLLFRPFHLQRVAAGDHADSECIPNRAQILVTAAEEEKSLVSAIQGQGQARCGATHTGLLILAVPMAMVS